MSVLGLRIDVDTYDGLRVGVPRLLERLRRLGLRATFFVTFGPERAGLALGRLRDPRFVWKALRNRALRTYGWRTILGGAILPARRVGESQGRLLREVLLEGHELGLHGYDHFGWQRRIHRMRPGEIEVAFRAGISAFEEAVGLPPAATAAPGWRTTGAALAVQDRFGFRYASDTRGRGPFRAQWGEMIFLIPQIPTTLPTMDELVGTRRDLSGALVSGLRPGLNVFTAHAEIEGGWLVGEFERFLLRTLALNVPIHRLSDLAGQLSPEIETAPVARVEPGRVSGRSGWVLRQRGGVDAELVGSRG